MEKQHFVLVALHEPLRFFHQATPIPIEIKWKYNIQMNVLLAEILWYGVELFYVDVNIDFIRITHSSKAYELNYGFALKAATARFL